MRPALSQARCPGARPASRCPCREPRGAARKSRIPLRRRDARAGNQDARAGRRESRPGNPDACPGNPHARAGHRESRPGNPHARSAPPDSAACAGSSWAVIPFHIRMVAVNVGGVNGLCILHVDFIERADAVLVVPLLNERESSGASWVRGRPGWLPGRAVP